MPSDTLLLEALFDWAGHDPALIERILVTNPQQLYGFN